MLGVVEFVFFFFQAEDGIRDVAVTGVQTCALPIWVAAVDLALEEALRHGTRLGQLQRERGQRPRADRKSTRLNSSHGYISYAVFCLKKKKSMIAPSGAATAHTRGIV